MAFPGRFETAVDQDGGRGGDPPYNRNVVLIRLGVPLRGLTRSGLGDAARCLDEAQASASLAGFVV